MNWSILLAHGENTAELLRQLFQLTHNATHVDEYGRDMAAVERARPIANFFYKQYWRVQTRGIEYVPQTGPALIVANHSGALAYDAVMIHMAILNEAPGERLTRFLAENFIYYLPFVGTFINRLGGVRACPENAERLLRDGELVAVFPEGLKGIGKLYKDRYHLARFGRGGAVRLAIKTGVPIIPCAVVGAEEIHPMIHRTQTLAKLFGLPFIPVTPTFPWLGPIGCMPLPSQWVITFGKPIDYSHLPSDTVDDPFALHSLTENLRGHIQTLVHDGLATRKEIVDAILGIKSTKLNTKKVRRK